MGWLVVLINVDIAIFRPYLDLEAGDNQSLKIQVASSQFATWILDIGDFLLLVAIYLKDC